ncbi:MAG TPA: tetratricopeptide repeat protein, partial [Gemmataceae bacterium]|nr:tetratricopeptide repeat protein [Gemmataceae bacterium]
WYHRNRCNLCVLKGEFKKADVAFIDGVKANTASPKPAKKGQIRVPADVERRIFDKYMQLIGSSHENAKTHLQRGWFYCVGGEHDKALAELNDSIRLDPSQAFAHAVRGMNHLQKGDVESAMRDFSEAIRLRPECTVARYCRGLMYGSKKEYDRAITDLTEVIRMAPASAASIYYRARAFAEKGELDRAAADFTCAIKINPQEADWYVARAWCYGQLKQYDKALDDCGETIRLNPQCSKAYSIRGCIYQQRGETDKAIADYTEALRLDRHDSTAQQNLRSIRSAQEHQKNWKQLPASENKQDSETRYPGLRFFSKFMHLDTDFLTNDPSPLEERPVTTPAGEDAAPSNQSLPSDKRGGLDTLFPSIKAYSKPAGKRSESLEYDSSHWLRESK